MTRTVDNDEITAWLTRNATPVQVIPGGDTRDLEPLKKILGSARIIGLAESTHGTREFFQIRHRLLRFLVAEMGFNTIALEASYSAVQAVNEYVLRGKGDRSSVLTGLGFVMWDVQEFSDVVDWLHVYNMSVHEARKVRFYGLDIWNTHLGRERVLAHLKIVAPEQITLIEPLFREVAAGEARGLLRAHERVDIQSFIKLQRLTEFLSANSDSFARQTSVDDCLDVDQHLRVILRWMSANLSDKIVYELPLQVPNKAGLNNFARSWYMAENLLDGMARDEVGSKVVVWAHVFHLGVGVEDPTLGVTANMGKYLRERFGEQYYVFGLELDGGTYLARVWRLDDTLGDFKIGTLPAAPEGTLPWHLSRTNMRSLMLDLRNCPKSQEIQRWLGTPQDMHAVSWLHRDEQVRYIKQSILQVYDGIIFIGHTSATTPSKNAHRTVSERPETCTRTKAVW